MRLREREIDTIFRLGCSRSAMASMLAGEVLLILLASSVICGVFLVVVSRYDQVLVRSLFI